MGIAHIGTENNTLTCHCATVGLAASKYPFLCLLFQLELTSAGKVLVDSAAHVDLFMSK